MPLIVIVGLPASGKTKCATNLKKFFEFREKHVHVVSENETIPKAGFTKNSFYVDSEKEKQIRSELKSEVLRLLNKDDVIIFDALNYIKGYRYELFCATKSARTTQCTLFCAIPMEQALYFNGKRLDPDTIVPNNSTVAYTLETCDALYKRFEAPQSTCRWDSPLFVTFPEDNLDYEGIYNALFETKPLPPNLSTQNPPLGATNYLFDMDRITQSIVNDINSAQKIGAYGPLRIQGSSIPVNVKISMNPMQLNRVRRQFISYSKSQYAATSPLEKIPQLFVQFINSNMPSS